MLVGGKMGRVEVIYECRNDETGSSGVRSPGRIWGADNSQVRILSARQRLKMICQRCGEQHDGSYGSGRFCCAKCARSFSSNTRSAECKKYAARGLVEYTRKLSADIHAGLASKDVYKWTDEQKQKHSDRMKRVMSTPSMRAKLSKAISGRPCTEHAKQILSQKAKARWESGENEGWTIRRGQESYAEKFWKRVLENNNIQYQQEYKINKIKDLGIQEPGNYFLDFVLPGMVDLEIDGRQHRDLIEHDKIRDERITGLGYKVYRIKYINPNSITRKEAVKKQIDEFLAWYSQYK